MAGPGIQTDAIDFDPTTADPAYDPGLAWYRSDLDHMHFQRTARKVRPSEETGSLAGGFTTRVPSSGTQYFAVDGVMTSLVPFVIARNGRLLRWVLKVDVADTNDYALETVVNGSVARSTTLLAGTTQLIDTSPLDVSALDEVQLRLVRASGSGQSVFRSARVNILTGE